MERESTNCWQGWITHGLTMAGERVVHGEGPYGCGGPYQPQSSSSSITAASEKQQQLHAFWVKQYVEIEATTNFKNHSLPPVRIQKIVKADDRVGGEKKK
ncbi:hypothetical protein QJS10_CPA03g01895 [Acorus calamus]|uniref:Uncharacterized protein n=1 Tax=Acorus calamus TaxID=4465 RepID=A0AAV9F7K4_ACOCL|nr:hypothetical protein QJS10_CPA03g01895 [Acorus calamus]